MKTPPGQGRDGGTIRFILWLVATEMTHMIEEVVAGFLEDFSLLFNVTVTCEMFAASFLIASAVGVLAALGLIYWNPIANYFVWLSSLLDALIRRSPNSSTRSNSPVGFTAMYSLPRVK